MELIKNRNSAMKAFRLRVDSPPRNYDNDPRAIVPDHFPQPYGVNLRRVEKEDYTRPDGRFRGVLKLSMKWSIGAGKDRLTSTGTAWLIEKDLMVTAAHNVRVKRFGGNALSVTAYMGYAGSTPSPHSSPIIVDGLQRRSGTVVVVPAPWYFEEDDSAQYDIAFVRLDKPFEIPDSQLLRYGSTPDGSEWDDRLSLVIVGYPGMGKYLEAEDLEMCGDRMCRSNATFWEWDENCPYKHLFGGSVLFDKADILSGMSGGPVFWHRDGLDRDGFVIGTMAYRSKYFYAASPIGMREGDTNFFPDYIALLDAIREGNVTWSPDNIFSLVRKADGSFIEQHYWFD
ncbi:hypothetical protein V8F20_006955 [Naviculisporaceae sp. PSN 640]